MDPLTILLGDYPLTHAFLGSLRLADGSVLKHHTFAETGGARAAMARMVRELPGLDYDICDLPLVNYISAKEHGAKFTALPVILTRRFQHSGIWGDERQGIREPKDLEGKRVGLGYHGHTDLTWVRGIMSDVYGVDLDSITWITSDPEGVPKAPLPKNVWQIPGSSFPALVESGVIAGAVLPQNQSFDNPAVRRLVTDLPTAERDWFRKTGVFPQLHTVVVKNSVLKTRPTLATELYRALSASKAAAYAKAAKGMTDVEAAATAATGFLVSPADRKNRPYLGDDPLPFGLEPNRAGFEMIVRFAREQKITAWQPPIEELFVAVDEGGAK
jgi:4,5-dihydroxyphthalate decarboxylase